MKRLFMIVAFLATATLGYSQSVIIVDSEKIFRSLESYTKALEEVDALSKSYQSQVDAKFDNVENLYNYYVAHKSEYSATMSQSKEAEILNAEREATEFQEQHFSKDGTIMKRRLELITPIQEKVFGAIESYAKARGADVVLDESANPSLLYGASAVNHTQGVIDMLK